jgi:hypothetical protein
VQRNPDVIRAYLGEEHGVTAATRPSAASIEEVDLAGAGPGDGAADPAAEYGTTGGSEEHR